ncbi:hypothetical protein BLNAU_14996 [Blattamonas nauphoetae]|uniref:Cyclin N-terminal domain-containing protein n=1 Tax=Blattamonas nauphoetae TaxID=2049346 RepID=A0ABQ9XEF8_9EUKA|nr:hypothetical protein BLNAU_14996 [Blattamonas nauphoetae]
MKAVLPQPVPSFITSLALYLEHLCSTQYDYSPEVLQKFQEEPTHISLEMWVYHLFVVSQSNSVCPVLACCLLEYIRLTNPSLPICSLNVRRLFLVALMVICKTTEDVTFRNEGWVVIGMRAFSLHTLNSMEADLLNHLQFRVQPRLHLLLQFLTALMTHFPCTLPDDLACFSAFLGHPLLYSPSASELTLDQLTDSFHKSEAETCEDVDAVA